MVWNFANGGNRHQEKCRCTCAQGARKGLGVCCASILQHCDHGCAGSASMYVPATCGMLLQDVCHIIFV